MTRLFALALCLLFLVADVQAQEPSAGEFKAFFDAVEKDTLFNGNVLIAHKGKIVFQTSIGYADFTTHRKLNENSVFELASVSKQFTAMAIMILVEQGKLHYDDILRKFIPELPYYDITIRHLLTHTSGLPDYMELMMKHWDKTKIANNEDMIAMLAKRRPLVEFAPGEKYEYSNTGYALLGSIVERVSKKSFADFLNQSIFKPLGMKHTLVYNRRYRPKKIENYAFGYVMDQSRRLILPDSNNQKNYVIWLDGIVGDGAVNSTIGDLMIWDRALNTAKLLKKESLAEAFRVGRLNNGDTTNYGFGWQLGFDSVLGQRYYHSGGWPGYATFISRYPKSDWTFIALRNAESKVGISFVLAEIARISRGKKPLYTQASLTLPLSTVDRYVGTYRLEEGFDLTFSIEGERTFVQVTGQPKGEVFASSPNSFFSRTAGAEIEFIMGTNGKAETLVLRQGGTFVCPRVGE